LAWILLLKERWSAAFEDIWMSQETLQVKLWNLVHYQNNYQHASWIQPNYFPQQEVGISLNSIISHRICKLNLDLRDVFSFFFFGLV
jgi:hypothetical protein